MEVGLLNTHISLYNLYGSNDENLTNHKFSFCITGNGNYNGNFNNGGSHGNNVGNNGDPGNFQGNFSKHRY